MKTIFKLIAGLLILVIAFVVFVGIFFISGGKKDLGIVYSQKAYESANTKSGVALKSMTLTDPTAPSIILEGRHRVITSYSSQEITSIAQNRSWVNWPFTEVQVRFNADKSIVSSGFIDLSKAVPYALAIGIPREAIDRGLKYAGLPLIKIPFYIKLTGTVTNNTVQLNIESLQAGRISVPAGIIAQYQPALTQFLSRQLDQSPNIEVQKMEIKNGKVYFDGMLPDVEKTVNK